MSYTRQESPGKALDQQVQNSSAGKVLGVTKDQVANTGLTKNWASESSQKLGFYSKRKRIDFYKNYTQTASSPKSGKIRIIHNTMLHRILHTLHIKAKIF